jgi:ABC-type multidrug transport system ATPase subunit/ABC-type transporter Mla maintaining outer membrane lipid asymmetry permease subunit MlaE
MNDLGRLPALSLVGLSIEQPGGTVLLRDASLDLYPGEVVLLVGAVGSGKSTLLRVLAGLLSNGRSGWRISGRLATPASGTIDLARQAYPAGAMVFQDHALFDDLTVGENLDIAASHVATRSGVTETLVGALTRGIPPDGEVSACSGGQKQLVAIARTVVAGPPILLFDEPNSGLDAGKVVRLTGILDVIKREARCPLLITAHHVEHLLPIADRVVFLDPGVRSLVPLEKDAAAIDARLRTSGLELDPAAAAAAATGDEAPPRVVVQRSRAYWLWRFFRQYMWSLCFSPEALLYMALGGVLIGFVTTWFALRHFPMSSYLVPLFHEELLASIGFVQFRILIPLMTAVLLASRSGAIIAADLGHRVYSNQIDAMKNLGLPWHWYLGANIVVACLLSSIVSVAFMFAVSSWVSRATWTQIFPHESHYFWKDSFFRVILRVADPVPVGFGWVLAKTTISAVAVGAVSILLGLARKSSVLDLNRAIALAVVGTVALVLSVHTVIAFLEF